MITVQYGSFDFLCAQEDRFAKHYFEVVRYVIGVADLACTDEHMELLLYVMEDTPTLHIRSLAHAPDGTRGLYVLIKCMREQSVPNSFSPVPLRA